MSSARAAAVPAGVVRYLAVQAATWPVLYAYRHQGLGAAITVLGECGGCGRGDDGVWRSWFTESRGRLRYQEGNTRAPIVRMRLSEVLAWAERQLTPAEWTRIEALVTERRAARGAADRVRQEAAQRAGQPPWSPDRLLGLTDAEAARLAELGATQSRAERELTHTVRAALTAVNRAGEQLDLFADLAPPQPTADP